MFLMRFPIKKGSEKFFSEIHRNAAKWVWNRHFCMYTPFKKKKSLITVLLKIWSTTFFCSIFLYCILIWNEAYCVCVCVIERRVRFHKREDALLWFLMCCLWYDVLQSYEKNLSHEFFRHLMLIFNLNPSEIVVFQISHVICNMFRTNISILLLIAGIFIIPMVQIPGWR